MRPCRITCVRESFFITSQAHGTCHWLYLEVCPVKIRERTKLDTHTRHAKVAPNLSRRRPRRRRPRRHCQSALRTCLQKRVVLLTCGCRRIRRRCICPAKTITSRSTLANLRFYFRLFKRSPPRWRAEPAGGHFWRLGWIG